MLSQNILNTQMLGLEKHKQGFVETSINLFYGKVLHFLFMIAWNAKLKILKLRKTEKDAPLFFSQLTPVFNQTIALDTAGPIFLVSGRNQQSCVTGYHFKELLLTVPTPWNID